MDMPRSPTIDIDLPQKSPKKQKKLTPKEKIILKNYNPELSTYQNLKPLADKGLVDMRYGYSRLKKSQYLIEKIDLLNTHWEEFLVREAMPIASKNVLKKLKGKDGDTFPATKLVMDTYYKRNEQPVMVHNTYIEQIQAMFGGGVDARDEREGVIDLRAEDKVGGG